MSGHAALLVSLRKHIGAVDNRHQHHQTDNAFTRLDTGYELIDGLLNGGLACNGIHEIRCSYTKDIGAACGFVSGLLVRRNLLEKRKVIWICGPVAAMEGGQLFPDGLRQGGMDPFDILLVKPTCMKDALWSAGEAARAGNLCAIVLHIKGNEKTFDLNTSRQLMLRAHESSTMLFVLRQAGQEEASSALTRWHVAPARSRPDSHFQKGVGSMRLALTLERNRNGPLGKWIVAWNPVKRSFEDAAETHAKKTTRSPKAHSCLSLHTSENRPHRQKTLG